MKSGSWAELLAHQRSTSKKCILEVSILLLTLALGNLQYLTREDVWFFFSRLGTGFRNGLYLCWLHAYQFPTNKATTNPIFSPIAILQRKKNPDLFHIVTKQTCHWCLSLSHPSLFGESNISLQDANTCCFLHVFGKMLEKKRPLGTDHTCLRDQWNQTKTPNSKLKPVSGFQRAAKLRLRDGIFLLPFTTEKYETQSCNEMNLHNFNIATKGTMPQTPETNTLTFPVAAM